MVWDKKVKYYYSNLNKKKGQQGQEADKLSKKKNSQIAEVQEGNLLFYSPPKTGSGVAIAAQRQGYVAFKTGKSKCQLLGM